MFHRRNSQKFVYAKICTIEVLQTGLEIKCLNTTLDLTCSVGRNIVWSGSVGNNVVKHSFLVNNIRVLVWKSLESFFFFFVWNCLDFEILLWLVAWCLIGLLKLKFR